mgnify:CR=1 FL=1
MSDLKAKISSMPIFKVFDADMQSRMLAQGDDGLMNLITYLEEQTPSWQKSREDLQNVIQEAPHQFQREVSKFMQEVEAKDKKVEIAKAEAQIDQNLNS